MDTLSRTAGADWHGARPVLLSAAAAIAALIVLFSSARYFWLSESLPAVAWLTDVSWTLAALAGAAAALRVAVRQDGRVRLGWTLIGAGALSWVAGMLIWSWLHLHHGIAVPFPSAADPFFLATALLCIAGMFLLRSPVAGRPLDFLQVCNLGIVASAVLLVVPSVFLDAVPARGPLDLYAATALAWPVVYIAATFFGVVCLVFYTEPRNREVFLLLVASLGVHSVAACLYARSLLSDTYEVGASFDILWLVAFGFAVLAALRHHLGDSAGAPARESRGLTRRRQFESLLPASAVAIVLVAGLIFTDRLDGATLDYSLSVGLVLTGFLALWHWTAYRHEQRRADEATRAERNLGASEARYRSVVDNSRDLIYLIGGDDRIAAANPAACEALGYRSDEIVGLRREAFTLITDELKAGIAARGRTGHYAGEAILIARDGRRFPVEVSSSQYPDPSGEEMVCVIARDISERKRHDEELRRARFAADTANRAKSEFLANMSHELRTPLNAIIGFSELIERQSLGPAATQRYVEYAGNIRTSGEMLLAIINDVLDLSRIEAGKHSYRFVAVDLAELAQMVVRVVRPRADEGQLSLVVDMPTDLPRVQADEKALRQILLNLLSNAIKFTSKQGRISVAGRRLTDGDVELSVSDTGIGITAQDLDHVFDRFWRGEPRLDKLYPGTGLGLSICRSLAEAHEATLELESEPGVGTTARLRFPSARAVS